MIESIPPAAWAAVTAAVGGLVGWLSTRGKNEADVSSVLAETSISLLNELRAEDKRMRERLELVEAEVVDCEQRYEILEQKYDRVIDYLRERGCEMTFD